MDILVDFTPSRHKTQCKKGSDLERKIYKKKSNNFSTNRDIDKIQKAVQSVWLGLSFEPIIIKIQQLWNFHWTAYYERATL